MRTIVFLLAFEMFAPAGPQNKNDLTNRMGDRSLDVTQRIDACHQLRGEQQTEILTTMRRALGDPDVRACAASNLRAAGALDLFRDAIRDAQPEVRAIAVREIGGFGKPEDLPALGTASQDSDLLVATNAVYGLAMYPGPQSVHYLVEAARRGGITGEQALRLLAQRREPEALTVARALLLREAIPDRLAAVSIIGEMGDRSDLASLHEIQAKETAELSNKGRGFGFVPSFSLSRAARTAVENIESRQRSN